jgi:hypothetical protein
VIPAVVGVTVAVVPVRTWAPVAVTTACRPCRPTGIHRAADGAGPPTGPPPRTGPPARVRRRHHHRRRASAALSLAGAARKSSVTHVTREITERRTRSIVITTSTETAGWRFYYRSISMILLAPAPLSHLDLHRFRERGGTLLRTSTAAAALACPHSRQRSSFTGVWPRAIRRRQREERMAAKLHVLLIVAAGPA